MRSHANSFLLYFLVVGLFLSLSAQSRAQTAVAPSDSGESQAPQAVTATDSVRPGTISGTVEDAFGDVVPGAAVVLDSPTEHKSSIASENGFFQFSGLTAGTAYKVTISANGFDPWVSASVVLTPGEFFEIAGIHLKLEDAFASVTVTANQTEI